MLNLRVYLCLCVLSIRELKTIIDMIAFQILVRILIINWKTEIKYISNAKIRKKSEKITDNFV